MDRERERKSRFPIVVRYPFATVYIHPSYAFVEFFMDIQKSEKIHDHVLRHLDESDKLRKFETILEDKMFNDAMRVSYGGGK